MAITIPQANGVPGIGGPPDWFPPGGNFRLDDVRWTGATQRTFGAGAGQNVSQRAVQGTVGGQQFLFLSFRAGYVPALSDQWDAVFIGLRGVGGSEAMVLRIQPHGASFTPAGPPSANPPAAIVDVDAWTRASGATSWTFLGTPPAWVAPNAFQWLQSAATAPPSDPNNRWAIQVRVPVKSSGGITDNDAVNLGSRFQMWYLILATIRVDGFDQPAVIADYRASGTTAYADILFNHFPTPNEWDTFDLSTSAATDGGVTIQLSDVLVSNLYGNGTTLANGQANTFIARPRNYRANAIAPAEISATFRIANWGSLAGNPDQPDFTSGSWTYVEGNSELVPVPSNIDILPLSAGDNPPLGENPIQLTANIVLPSGASFHQCILATLSGTTLNFLSNSVFQNMEFVHSSRVEREAQISIQGLGKTAKGERDVIIATEKRNMPDAIPGGADEGLFLDASRARLIEQGGELAEKLKVAQTLLAREQGDFGSMARLSELTRFLAETLASVGDQDSLRDVITDLSQWLLEVKQSRRSASRMALASDLLSRLISSGSRSIFTPARLSNHLRDWLTKLNSGASERASQSVKALANWLALQKETRAELDVWGETMNRLAHYLQPIDGRTSDERVAELQSLLEVIESQIFEVTQKEAGPMRRAIGTFGRGLGLWLRGDERLQFFVDVLHQAEVTTEELDQLFPTMRMHVYHDTGDRVIDGNGISQVIWREQSSFGTFVLPEAEIIGWSSGPMVDELSPLPNGPIGFPIGEGELFDISVIVQPVELEEVFL